jgi:hypothetical protein
MLARPRQYQNKHVGYLITEIPYYLSVKILSYGGYAIIIVERAT